MTKKKIKQKLSKSNSKVLLLVLVLIGAVFFYLFILKQSIKTDKEIQTNMPKYIQISSPSADISTWNTYTDENSNFTIKYASNVIIDPVDNNAGGSVSFIFADENPNSLPRNTGNYEHLSLRNRGTNLSGFQAYVKGECGQPCGEKEGNWKKIQLNNAYGVDMSGRFYNVTTYYLNDKDMKGDAIQASVGPKYFEGIDEEKMNTLQEMLKTYQFNR